MTEKKRESVVGARFGRLVVQSIRNEITDTGLVTYAVTKCDCGKDFELRKSNLYRTKSCGCFRREFSREQINKRRKQMGRKQRVWTYKAKKYYTDEISYVLFKACGFALTKKQIRALLLSRGMAYTLRKIKSLGEPSKKKVKDLLGYKTVTELIKASSLSRQGFYNVVNLGYKPTLENGIIVWTKETK